MGNDQDGFLRATMGAMDLVFNLSRRLTDNRQDAEDLVQDTYLRAFRAWTDLRRPKRVEPWIATICLNLARSGYRTRARRPSEVPLEDWMVAQRPGMDPESRAIQRIEREELYSAMHELPDQQRVAITLVDLSGLSTFEAAEAMGTPRGTVLSRLHRGRRTLARLLGDRIEEVIP
ncbi:MAG: sigma-70 family RNA polymerase sigma factor [Actinobacteria bacterium]|nr:sigma-70 family RNA polymerase sigma factor [Actinomycetota bacterium]